MYFNPSGKPSTVTLALTSSTSTNTGGIGCPSTAVMFPASITGAVVSPVSGLESLSFGSVPFSFSVLSSTPSLSSSVSVTSGVPSPSVSLKIVTAISFVDSFPASSTALIFAVIVFSSLSPQSSAFGTVPSICLVSGL